MLILSQQWLDEINERAQKDKARSAELSKGTERLLKEERAKRMQAKEKSQIPATFEGIFGVKFIFFSSFN